MLRNFASILTLFSFLFAQVAAAEVTYESLRASIELAKCEALVTGKGGPPTITINERPEVTGFFSALFGGSFAERGQQQTNLARYDREQTALRDWQRSITAARAKFLSDRDTDLIPLGENLIPSQLQLLVQELRNRVGQLVAEAQSEAQLTQILVFFRQTHSGIKLLGHQLSRAQQEANSQLSSLEIESRRQRAIDSVAPKIAEARAIIRQSITPEAMAEVVASTRALIEGIFVSARAAEAERILRELRFDAADLFASEGILRALESVRVDLRRLTGDQEARLGEFTNEGGMIARAQGNWTLRETLYRELQFLRRLRDMAARQREAQPVESARIAAGALLRDTNTANALAADRSGNALDQLTAVRRALVRLNHRNTYRGVADPRSIRHLNLFEREALAAEAMKSPEVMGVMLGGAVELPTNLTAPVAPSPPTRPSGPRVSPAEVRAYNRSLLQMNSDWANYRFAYQDYSSQVARLRDSLQRRREYRHAFTAFLAERFPEFFVSQAQASATQERYRQIAQSRLDRLSAENRALVEQRARDRRAAAETSSSSSNLSGWDFFFYLYTGNPMWLINRDIAFLMMIADGRHFASSALAAPASVLTPESLGISNPMSSLRLSPDQEAQLQNFRDASLAAAAEAPPIPLVEVGALTPQEIEALGTNGVADLAVPPPEMTVLDLAVPSAGLVPEAPLALEPMQTPAPGSFDLAPMRLREARGGSGAGVDDRPFTTYEAPAERNEAPAETNESPPDPPSSYSGPSE